MHAEHLSGVGRPGHGVFGCALLTEPFGLSDAFVSRPNWDVVNWSRGYLIYIYICIYMFDHVCTYVYTFTYTYDHMITFEIICICIYS